MLTKQHKPNSEYTRLGTYGRYKELVNTAYPNIKLHFRLLSDFNFIFNSNVSIFINTCLILNNMSHYRDVEVSYNTNIMETLNIRSNNHNKDIIAALNEIIVKSLTESLNDVIILISDNLGEGCAYTNEQVQVTVNSALNHVQSKLIADTRTLNEYVITEYPEYII